MSVSNKDENGEVRSNPMKSKEVKIDEQQMSPLLVETLTCH
jgi:hypothetical protein